jgi:pimeloyl-ACP methyl ester carboxylesterase
MAIYVLVHGAGSGGWSWRHFAPLLRARGHEVFAPSLTGLGERAHLSGPQVTLSTHIQDVVNIFEFEELEDVILVGHSYGGMVITGVVEQIGERVAHLVYEDAFLPKDGQSCGDLGGFGGPERYRARLEDGWKVPVIPRPGGPVTPRVEADALRRRPMPIGTVEEKVRLRTQLEEYAFSRT